MQPYADIVNFIFPVRNIYCTVTFLLMFHTLKVHGSQLIDYIVLVLFWKIFYNNWSSQIIVLSRSNTHRDTNKHFENSVEDVSLTNVITRKASAGQCKSYTFNTASISKHVGKSKRRSTKPTYLLPRIPNSPPSTRSPPSHFSKHFIPPPSLSLSLSLFHPRTKSNQSLPPTTRPSSSQSLTPKSTHMDIPYSISPKSKPTGVIYYTTRARTHARTRKLFFSPPPPPCVICTHTCARAGERKFSVNLIRAGHASVMIMREEGRADVAQRLAHNGGERSDTLRRVSRTSCVCCVLFFFFLGWGLSFLRERGGLEGRSNWEDAWLFLCCF